MQLLHLQNACQKRLSGGLGGGRGTVLGKGQGVGPEMHDVVLMGECYLVRERSFLSSLPCWRLDIWTLLLDPPKRSSHALLGWKRCRRCSRAQGHGVRSGDCRSHRCEALRGRGFDLPSVQTLTLTANSTGLGPAYTSQEDRHKCVENDLMQDVMGKPVKESELVRCVQRWAGWRRTEHSTLAEWVETASTFMGPRI